jgi:hypothetical protein
MKRIFCMLIAIMIIFTSAHAQEQDTNSTQDNACEGSWILQYYGGWVVRNNEGTILPLSSATIFYDCQKNQFFPSQDLSGFDVEIECLHASEKSNLPDVTKVFFFCR